MTERQKLLLEIERLNKEIIKLKEVIENKNAHVESKNKHIARLEKVISIMKKKVNLQFFDFSRRAHLAIESNGCVFAMQKLSVTWQSRGIFLCIPFLAIVVQSVTTEVVTLCTTVMLFRHPFGMARLLRKTKWELVIRDKNFLDLNTWLSLVDTRFVLLFL